MKLINESAFKYLSVNLPVVGAFVMLVLIPLLQWALDFQLIPKEYQAMIVGTVIPLLAFIGKKIYQPELHQIQGFAALPNKDENIKNLFSSFRKIAGGVLSQKQVDGINALIASISAPELKTTAKLKTLSPSGIELIAGFEGYRANAYLCPAKVWTIGFGTTVYPDGKRVKSGDYCTPEQAKAYKAHDLKKFEDTVSSTVKVGLTQNQFDALVSLAYNIGSNAFAGSTLVKKLNAGDYKAASDQFSVWNKGGGKVLQGLVNRRAKEKVLFLK